MAIEPNPKETVVECETVTESKTSSKQRERQFQKLALSLSSGCLGILLVLYIVLSLSLVDVTFPSGRNAWQTLWTILFLADVPASILRAVHKKKLCEFSVWGLSLFALLTLGMWFNLWHPYWVVVLAIPAYYCICSPIDKYNAYKRDK